MEDLTSGQSIDLSDPSLKSPIRYPFHQWTPGTWYSAVLQLRFVNEGDKSDIRMHVSLMNGWKWNLVVMFLLELITCVLVVVKFMKVRKPRRIVYAKVSEHHGSSPHSPMGDIGGLISP